MSVLDALGLHAGTALAVALEWARSEERSQQRVSLAFDGIGMSWPVMLEDDLGPPPERYSGALLKWTELFEEGIGAADLPIQTELEGFLSPTGMVEKRLAQLERPSRSQGELPALQLGYGPDDRQVFRDKGMVDLMNAQTRAFFTLLDTERLPPGVFLRALRGEFSRRDTTNAFCSPVTRGEGIASGSGTTTIRLSPNVLSVSSLTHELAHALDNLVGIQYLFSNGLRVGRRGGKHDRPRTWASSRVHIPKPSDGMVHWNDPECIVYPSALANFTRIVRPLGKQVGAAIVTASLERRWREAELPEAWLQRLQAGEKLPLRVLLDDLRLRSRHGALLNQGTIWSWGRSFPAHVFDFPRNLPARVRTQLNVLAPFLRFGHRTFGPKMTEDELCEVSWERAIQKGNGYWGAGYEVFARAVDQVAWHRARAAGLQGGWTARPGHVPEELLPWLSSLLAAALVQEGVPICPQWHEESQRALGTELESLALDEMPDIEQQAQGQLEGSA